MNKVAKFIAKFGRSRTVLISLAVSACMSQAAFAHPVKTDGKLEVEGAGYVTSGAGDGVSSSSGCVQTGAFNKSNLINACEGIEEPAAEPEEVAVEEPVAETPAAQPVARVETLTVDGLGLFDTGSDQLTAEGTTRINALIGDINDFKGVLGISVEGHTDSVGSEEYNQGLSERRAATVAAILTGQYPDVPVSSAGLGELEPVGDNATAEGRAANRRVEVGVEVSRMVFE